MTGTVWPQTWRFVDRLCRARLGRELTDCSDADLSNVIDQIRRETRQLERKAMR